ncbi:MAG: DUF5063 domain-containing protein [Phycisphaerales bacterium]|nr:DUF5063 domain-containing protein [Phycisphaerales bacterium]
MDAQPLEEFAAAARAYCALIDALTQDRPRNLYSSLERLLARLHAAILQIDADPDAPETPDAESRDRRHEQWKAIAQRLEQLTADETNQLYDLHIESWNTAKPADNYCAIRASMLWDDLADIYSDLRNGLRHWDMNTVDARREASWKWRVNYETHWGTHLARAIQTIHEIRYRLGVN